MRGQAIHPLIVAAREIAHLGPLDLDDPGAEVRQLPGTERRGNGVLEGNDGDAIQGTHSSLVQSGPACPAQRSGKREKWVYGAPARPEVATHGQHAWCNAHRN